MLRYHCQHWISIHRINHVPSNARNKSTVVIPNDLPLNVRQRLMHVERCLFWKGELQRADLVDTFGINPVQAATDFRVYMEMCPGNMEYNKSRRRYLPLAEFTPRLIEPTSLDEFVDVPSPLISVANWPLPKRRATTPVLLAMVAAVRERQMIEVQYQSLTGQGPGWRWLSPHAFASDGDRWHVRAFCHTRGEFRDFVLGRILSTRHIKISDVDATSDHDWNTFVDVLVTPNPQLEAEKRRVIGAEYELSPTRLETTLKIRQSMLFYVEAKYAPEVNQDPVANQLFVTRLQ